MKLLYITNIPTPYRNRRFLEMTNVFPEFGIDFTVLFMARTEPNREWSIELDDLTYPHVVYRGLHPTIGGMYAHMNFGFLARLLVKRNYQIAVVGGMGCPSHWVAPFVMGRAVTKILSVESNPESVRRTKGIALRMKRGIVSRYDAFQVTGHRARLYLEAIEPAVADRPFITLPNLVDEGVFAATGCKGGRRIRRELGIAEDQQLWVCPARLEEEKGLGRFLPLLRGLSGVKLVIAGIGSMERSLRRIIDEMGLSVELVGYQSEGRIVELYRAADLFVLPSLRDPSPLSPIEAIASGLPVLLSNRVGNYEDVLIEGWNGWGLDPSDVAGSQAVVRSVAELDREKLRSFGRRSRERYWKVFDTKTCVRRYAEQIVQVHKRLKSK